MDELDKFVDTFGTSPTPPNWAVGEVSSVLANGSAPPVVTVTWQGAQVYANCPRHYTPVIGHVVLMLRVGPQLNIIGAYS
jgi:hypothetical protein